MWLGFGINLLSGLALLAAYPAKALTNWVFFAKLALVVLALWVLQRMKEELVVAGGRLRARSPVRRGAWRYAPSCFFGVERFACRSLAYTHHILLASEAL